MFILQETKGEFTPACTSHPISSNPFNGYKLLAPLPQCHYPHYSLFMHHTRGSMHPRRLHAPFPPRSNATPQSPPAQTAPSTAKNAPTSPSASTRKKPVASATTASSVVAGRSSRAVAVSASSVSSTTTVLVVVLPEMLCLLPLRRVFPRGPARRIPDMWLRSLGKLG